MKDGWHDIGRGLSVYTENGIVQRATKYRHAVSAAPYKWDRSLIAFVNVSGRVKYNTFRKGFAEGRYTIF